MSEHFLEENSALLSNSVSSVDFFEKDSILEESDSNDAILTYDHMYATTTQNGDAEIEPADDDNSCQEETESEVKFLKDWLILHLDLIQQQNDEIVNKERTILILQQENEMLKERISCMERGAPFQASKFYDNPSGTYLEDNLDMTQVSLECEEEEDNKDSIPLLNICENGEEAPEPAQLITLEHNQTIVEDAAVHLPVILEEKLKTPESLLTTSLDIKSDIPDCTTGTEDFSFTVSETTSDFDPMRNLKISIRKKRLSNSSAVSNADSEADGKRPFRRLKKRRKRVLKDSQLLTTPDQYITESGDFSASGITGQLDTSIEIPKDTTLEVPRWRIKVYASCYSMEGTENLDDEVYNKRHSRLEIDERRRKRWDIQRIREQRVIEKLKQRQERTGSGPRSDEQEPVESLWPKIEDIKYLDVTEQLPVSAFGCPIPKATPSEFSLPWLNNPSLLVAKKSPARKVKRKSASKR